MIRAPPYISRALGKGSIVTHATDALTTRVAVVTGAGRGVGRAAALALAGAGADVALIDAPGPLSSTSYQLSRAADVDETARLVRETGQRALPLQADVRAPDDLAHAVERVWALLGPIDILVPNAGIFTWGRLWELSEAQWDETIDVNLKGVWLTIKAVAPHMIERRRGRIIAVASTAGFRPGRGYAHYVASKHGVIGLMQSLAVEVGEYGITANVVCPSRMRTAMVEYDDYYRQFARGDAATAAAMAGTTRAQHVLPMDYVPVSAVADAVVWLASDHASCITGVVFPVDAGTFLL
jgi:SDR family mycofactocin-dependent oxidoreductase